MNDAVFEYQGQIYPDYLKRGNAAQFIAPVAAHFCHGRGLDVGAGRWPMPGSTPVELTDGGDAMNIPQGPWDYIFSSHCMEHLANPVAAIEHWKSHIRPGGVLLLYLPHPDMKYWRPENCRKHLHMFRPADVAEMLKTLGFVNVIHSERDMAWSFCTIAFNPEATT